MFVARHVALDRRRKPAKVLSKFAESGDQPPLILLSFGVVMAGVVAWNEKVARTGLRMLAAHSLSTVGKLIGKGAIDRTRPEEALRSSRYRLEEGDSREGKLRSMPSGHSAGVTAVALAAASDFPTLTIPAIAAGGTVMAAQLPTKNHFLSDVLAGAAIGVLAAAVARALIPPFDEIRREPARPR